MTNFSYPASQIKTLFDEAHQLDANDTLAEYRNRYYIPRINGGESIYFTGNSLGLQPKATRELVNQELADWANLGVEGHFHANRPWYSYHEQLQAPAARLLGAHPDEVVHMQGLTANLHLLMVSFYRPTKTRYKILCEKKAFPSDQYALQSQVKYHGFAPDDALVEIAPRPGEHAVRDEDVLEAIRQHGDALALVMMGGVNYYSGQVFDMQSITAEAHAVGALCGFDLAHAAGNIELKLHQWQVDFAAWCTYKYLNSGPGGVGGVFVHRNHANSPNLPRFAGWWGHNKETRFKMGDKFDPLPGAEGWQLSNAPVMAMACHLAALQLFDEVGMDALLAKSTKLWEFTYRALQTIHEINPAFEFTLITPVEAHRHGCQLSLLVHNNGRKLFDALTDQRVICDWREPNVIRLAPVPMYNSFADIARFAEIISENSKTI